MEGLLALFVTAFLLVEVIIPAISRLFGKDMGNE